MNNTAWDTYTKLMSQEDLTLKYSDTATTAYFELESRTVVVPTFNFITPEITQLLISHEVAHARYTRYSLTQFKKYTNEFGCLFNIVEDAYIERKIQKDFPGLKEIFLNGYSQLIENNFFNVNKPLETYNLYERLNLYSKCSSFYNVPFEGKENEFAFRIKRLNSSSEVINLCEDIVDYLDSLPNNFSDKSKDNTDSNNSQDDEENESFDSVTKNTTKESEDFEDSDENKNESSDFEKTQNESSEDKNKNTEESDEDADDKDDSDEENKESNSLNSEDNLEDSITKDFEEKLKEYGESLREKNNNTNLESYSTKDCDIFTFDYLEKEADAYFNYKEVRARKNLVVLVKNLAKTATTIFQQKKSANELANTKNRSIGKINMKKIQKYQLSENIFKQVKSIPEGKNHAVIIMIDYSSSMSANKKIHDTIIQATILAEFCYINDIPFEVILFGSIIHTNDFAKSVPVKLCDNLHYKAEYLLAFAFGFCGINEYMNKCYYIRMGGTPTFYSLLSIYRNLRKFKENGIEKTSVYIITDGVHSYDNDAKSMSINNVIYDIEDYIKDPIHKNWSIELACLFLKKQFNCYISFSYIGFSFMDMVDYSGSISKRKFFEEYTNSYDLRYDTIRFFDECMYILKHQFYFPNKNKLSINKYDKYLSYSFNSNPFLDQAQVIFSEPYISPNEESILTKKVKMYNIYSIFVNNFVNQIA